MVDPKGPEGVEEQEQELQHLKRWPMGKWLPVEYRQEEEKVGRRESQTQEQGEKLP